MAPDHHDDYLRAGTERPNVQKARHLRHTSSPLNNTHPLDVGNLNYSSSAGTRLSDRHTPASQEGLLSLVGYSDALRDEDMECTRANSVSNSTRAAGCQLSTSMSPTMSRIEARETANVDLSSLRPGLSKNPQSAHESTYNQNSNHFMEYCLQSWESSLPSRLVSSGVYSPFTELEPQRIDQYSDNSLRKTGKSRRRSSQSARASSTSILDGISGSQKQNGGVIPRNAEDLFVGAGTWTKQAK